MAMVVVCVDFLVLSSGARGTINGSYNANRGRWPVKIDGTRKQLSIKPINLKLLADPEEGAAVGVQHMVHQRDAAWCAAHDYMNLAMAQGGRPARHTAVEVMAMPWTPANHDAYMELVKGCSVADHLGLEKLYVQISLAVEQGDYKKLRFLRGLGVDLAFPFTVINEFGYSNINFALMTSNMPLLVFMAENGAELRYACSGPPGSDEFATPLEVAARLGPSMVPFAALIAALIEQQQAARDIGRPLAIGDRGYDHVRMAFLPKGSVETEPLKVITIGPNGQRTHEDGSSKTLPAPPWSGAPIADDDRTAEAKARGADPLVKELLRCQEADAVLEDAPSFDAVLAEEKRAEEKRGKK